MPWSSAYRTRALGSPAAGPSFRFPGLQGEKYAAFRLASAAAAFCCKTHSIGMNTPQVATGAPSDECRGINHHQHSNINQQLHEAVLVLDMDE